MDLAEQFFAVLTITLLLSWGLVWLYVAGILPSAKENKSMNRRDPDLVAYLKAINQGPLLASTVHNAVVEADNAGENWCSVGDSLKLWKILVFKNGAAIANKAVMTWINNPYQLPRSK
jgi:hypothetical protein